MTLPDETGRNPEALFDGVKRARPAQDLEDVRVRDAVGTRLFGEGPGPTRIDRFTLLEPVGQGGAGMVYAAYDPRLDRKVAIKVLHADQDRSAAEARLVREAQAAGRLSHPNVVSVFDVGVWEGRVYLAMDFLRGTSLKAWLEAEDRSPTAILEVFSAAGRGLAAAHREGIVHRDFKPSNVIVTEDPADSIRVRVVDFGLARVQGATVSEGAADPGVPHSDVALTLTQPGQRMGTPAYMAPEQHTGDPVDARADQFSFCVALFEAVVGRRPRRVPGSGAIAEAEFRALPGPLARPMRRGLREDPAERHRSMEALLAAIAPRPRRVRRAGAIAGAALVAAFGALWWSTIETPCAASSTPPEWYGERAALADAFAASTDAGAQETWRRVAPLLDQQAEAHAAASREICQRRASGELSASLHDQALACFAESNARMQSVASHLRWPTAATIRGAVDAVSSVDVWACRDPTRLLDRLAPPRDAATSQAVEEARVLKAEAYVARTFADYAGARARLSEARSWLPAGTFAPLDAELILLQANIDSDEELPHAGRTLAQAYRSAEACGHNRMRLLAATGLASHMARTDTSSAQVWAEVAGSLAARDETASVDRAKVLLAQADVAFESGKYADASAASEAAVAALEGEAHAGEHLRGTASYIAAQAAFFAGDLDEAARLAEQTRQAFVTALGPHHPRVATVLHLTGNIARKQSRLGEARRAYEAALAVFVATLGESNTKVAATRQSLALIAEMEGEFTTAEAEYLAAIEIMTAGQDARTARVAAIYDNLGIVYARSGRLAEAEAMFRHALGIGVETLGPDHPDVAASYRNVGSSLVDQGRYADGLPFLERAVAIRERALGREHAATLGPLEDVARAQRALGRSEAALATAARADRIARREYGDDAPQRVGPLTQHGRALIGLQRATEAAAALQRAIAIGPPTGVDAARLGRARFALAELLATQQAPARAVAWARAAKAALEHIEGEADALARVEAWLAARRR